MNKIGIIGPIEFQVDLGDGRWTLSNSKSVKAEDSDEWLVVAHYDSPSEKDEYFINVRDGGIHAYALILSDEEITLILKTAKEIKIERLQEEIEELQNGDGDD